MEDRKFVTQPLYVQLRQALTQRISSGVWKPGDTLPNETEIAREFGLSAGTVRKALDWMEQANLVVRQQGRGTFVCDPSSDILVMRYENIVSPSGAPVRGEPQLLSFTTGDATEAEQSRLRLKPGVRVHRIRQMRHSDGRPMLVKDVVISAALFPHVDETTYSISAAARASGVLLGRAEERIAIEGAVSPFAELLDVPPATPLLRLDRTVFAIDGRPVEWRLSHCHLGDNVYLARTGAAN
jgi:GntR family transcriptional regulator